MDKLQINSDRPIKFTEQDEKSLVRAITILHNTHGFSFTDGKIKNEAGLHHGALKTVRQYISKNNYYFWQLCRKGQATARQKKNESFMLKKSLY